MNVKKVASFAVGPIGAAVLGFITLPIITWFFSAEDIGRISMLQVVTSFSVLLFCLGLDQAYVREYHEAEQKPALLKTTLMPGLGLLLLVSTVLLLVPGAVSVLLFDIDSVAISALVVFCLLLSFISRFLSLVLRMQERGLAYSMSQVLPKALFLVVIGIYVLFSFGFDFSHLVTAHVISISAVTLIFAWNTRGELLTSLAQKVNKEKLIAMLKFGLPLIMGGVAFWGLTAMDKLFLRGLSTFEELGIFSVAVSFAAAAIIFQQIFSTVWAPTVYKWAAEGINPEKIDQVTEHVLAVVVFIFALAGLFSWIVSYLLPDTYDKVQYMLVACMAYPLLYTLSETTAVGIGLTRKSLYAMVASIVAAVVNLIGNYLLIPIYGAAGAAVSTAIAFWIFFFLRTEFACRVWRPLPRKKLYSTTLISLAAAIAFTLVGEEHYWISIAVWILMLFVWIVVFKRSLVEIYLLAKQ